MTSQAVLIELLDRVATLPGEKVLIGEDELIDWPADAVEAMKAYKLIQKTSPATSILCKECEEECVRPVHIANDPSGEPRVFIICEKRDDVNQVPVPINRLEQWHTSGALVAEMLSTLLGLIRPVIFSSTADRWEIGMFRGKKHSSHMVLTAEDNLSLTLAGHSIPLAEVLTLENNHFAIDQRKLTRLVDHPIAGSGDIESAEQRRARIKKRVNHLKDQGEKAFLKTVAEEENLSITRIKQLIRDDNPSPKPKNPYW